jgi:hypothetical protein
MKPIKIARVQSQSNKSKSYLVEIYADGSATCECPYFEKKLHGDPQRQCKHIKRYFEYKKNGGN